MNLVSYTFTPDWQHQFRIAATPYTEQVAHFAGWTVIVPRRQLVFGTGVRTQLAPVEFTLLMALLEAPHRIVGRDCLLRALNARADVSLRTVDCYVSRLRRRLAVGASVRSPIETIRGRGYLLDADVTFDQVVRAPVSASWP